MSAIRDVPVKSAYFGKGSAILDDFLLPLLGCAKTYDRISGYYSTDSLLAISHGLQSIWERHGNVRVIMGVQSIPEEFVEVYTGKEALRREVEKVREDIVRGISQIPNELEQKRLATIAWMIDDGLLQVKAAASKSGGIFHAKTMIISDDHDTVVAVGSANETGSGLGSNFEQLMCTKSWIDTEGVETYIDFFEDLWSDKNGDAIVCEITDEVSTVLNEGIGRLVSNKPGGQKQKSSAGSIINAAQSMPTYFFVSGDVPGLYQHQERAVIDALSRWPVRVMLADEVGLGKTFEAAATMKYLMKYCSVKKAVILTPKAVLKQWQEELFEHFGLNAWLYDSASRQFVSPQGDLIPIGSSAPLGALCPKICLMSAQYARGSKSRPSVFEQNGAVLPDLLMVDEAHAARVGKDFSGKKKPTLLYRTLEKVSDKIPHLILATATPMQKDPSEYHAMLKLLGLPKAWSRERNYENSLQFIATNESLTLDDAATAAKLLLATVRSYHPDLSDLDQESKCSVLSLIKASESGEGTIELAQRAQKEWHNLKRAFIQLHPAHLLTVRNTRRSLEAIGYNFPKRNLENVEIPDTKNQRLLYIAVNQYLEQACFSVESALLPNKRFNMGFVRISYRQRMASSLKSCRESLIRRLEKVRGIKKQLHAGMLPNLESAGTFDLDTADEDDLLAAEREADSATAECSWEKVSNACEVESTSLVMLINRVNDLMRTQGDRKIEASIALAIKHVNAGDRVLVFSRYTDTVDALLEEYALTGTASYGVYDGSRSAIWNNGDESETDKNGIKRALESGDIKILFCSDAASEGLNLQAARVLINVDVPWTPSRLEQRIGRVARLGQKAPEVTIYNVWYPDSIEARMYGRIQSRLEGLNVAIGEFPEVISASIRDAVISGNDYDGIEELQDFRNSVQTVALQQLWTDKREKLTNSQRIRKYLLALIRKHLPETVTTSDGTLEVPLPDNTIERLTEDIGTRDTISLSSLALSHLDLPMDESIKVGKMKLCADPYAFVLKNDESKWIDLVDAMREPKQRKPKLISRERPISIPRFNKIRLDFALGMEKPIAPVIWPTSTEE